MEITKEDLKEQFDNLKQEIDTGFANQWKLTKGYLDADLKSFRTDLLTEIDKKLQTQTKKITESSEKFTMEAFETHQTWVEEHFKEWIEPYDVRVRVTRLEARVDQIED